MRLETGGRRQKARERRREAGGRRQDVGGRRQKAGDRGRPRRGAAARAGRRSPGTGPGAQLGGGGGGAGRRAAPARPSGGGGRGAGRPLRRRSSALTCPPPPSPHPTSTRAARQQSLTATVPSRIPSLSTHTVTHNLVASGLQPKECGMRVCEGCGEGGSHRRREGGRGAWVSGCVGEGQGEGGRGRGRTSTEERGGGGMGEGSRGREKWGEMGGERRGSGRRGAMGRVAIRGSVQDAALAHGWPWAKCSHLACRTQFAAHRSATRWRDL
jgi:hypothetical protein